MLAYDVQGLNALFISKGLNEAILVCWVEVGGCAIGKYGILWHVR